MVRTFTSGRTENEMAATESTQQAVLETQLDVLDAVRVKYAIRIDEVSATLSYVGKAAVGSATSAASWQVQKLDSTSGLIITWADGNSNYDNVWDDRASLTFS